MAREGSVVFTWLNLQEFDYRQQLLSAFCSRSSEANFLAERERKGKWGRSGQWVWHSSPTEAKPVNPVSFSSSACASFWLVSSVAFNRIFRQPAGPFGRGVQKRGVLKKGTRQGGGFEVLHFACWLKRFISRFQTWLPWQLTRLESCPFEGSLFNNELRLPRLGLVCWAAQPSFICCLGTWSIAN